MANEFYLEMLEKQLMIYSIVMIMSLMMYLFDGPYYSFLVFDAYHLVIYQSGYLAPIFFAQAVDSGQVNCCKLPLSLVFWHRILPITLQ